jgi:hypothetical protein
MKRFLSILFVMVSVFSLSAMGLPSPLLAQEAEARVPSTEAVYVMDGEETNLNSGAERTYLLVCPRIEMAGERETLIRFFIGLSKGAEIQVTGASIKLYQQSASRSGSVDIYALESGFDEDTVTWNTKPLRGAFQSHTHLEAGTGPRYLDIPTTLVESWIESPSTNYGIVLVYSGLGANCHVFSSDETGSPPTLIISYKGEPGPITPPPPEDTVPCEISYTVTPPSPRAGQEVTITATATDNEAMDYISIQSIAGEVLAFKRAEAGERTLTISATLVAQLPALRFFIRADDYGVAPPAGVTVSIPTGTNTTPLVTIEVDWEIEKVIPEYYKLIKEDGQSVTITVTATDPDGIDSVSINVPGGPYQFSYHGGETSVSESIIWVNDDPSWTEFYCTATVRDRELNEGQADYGYFHIRKPEELLMWWALGFPNQSGPILSWDRMRQTFGDGECYWVESWGWKNPYASAWYWFAFRHIADGGLCFGMCTATLELYEQRIYAHQLENVLWGAGLWYPNSYTKEYAEARQGGQLSEEVEVDLIDQAVEWWAEPVVSRLGKKLDWIERDLESDYPGVIGMYEGDAGHSVVPWMVRYMSDGTIRVYVYDPNRVTGVHNPNGDINIFEQYPYLEFDLVSSHPGWSYRFTATSIWNDDLYYTSYNDACGDMDQPQVDPTLGEDAAELTDHDLLGPFEALVAVFSGDADVYVENEEGNITGIYQGEIREEIPGSAAIIPMMGGSFTDHEMYALPIDEKLTVHVVGKGEGEYGLSLMDAYSLYAVEEKSLSRGVEDKLTIEPFVGSAGHRLRIQPGKADDDFIVRLALMFEGRVNALDRDFIGREYIFERFSASVESDFSVYVEEGGDSAVVESYGDDIEFDVNMRSTESADYVDLEQELPYIPSSSEEDVSVERGRRVTTTPDDWATTEERGEMHILTERVKGEGGVGFPIVPVVIGAVAIVAIVVGVVVTKRLVGRTKKG